MKLKNVRENVIVYGGIAALLSLLVGGRFLLPYIQREYGPVYTPPEPQHSAVEIQRTLEHHLDKGQYTCTLPDGTVFFSYVSNNDDTRTLETDSPYNPSDLFMGFDSANSGSDRLKIQHTVDPNNPSFELQPPPPSNKPSGLLYGNQSSLDPNIAKIFAHEKTLLYYHSALARIVEGSTSGSCSRSQSL